MFICYSNDWAVYNLLVMKIKSERVSIWTEVQYNNCYYFREEKIRGEIVHVKWGYFKSAIRFYVDDNLYNILESSYKKSRYRKQKIEKLIKS